MRRLIIAAVLTVALTGCGGDATGPREPTPGTLTVSLTRPSGVTTGAVIMTLNGPGAITQVAGAAGGYRVYSRPVTGGVRVAVFGTLTPGALVRFHVPDTGDADEYTAAVLEVAGTDNELEPATGYGLAIAE